MDLSQKNFPANFRKITISQKFYSKKSIFSRPITLMTFFGHFLKNFHACTQNYHLQLDSIIFFTFYHFRTYFLWKVSSNTHPTPPLRPPPQNLWIATPGLMPLHQAQLKETQNKKVIILTWKPEVKELVCEL